MRILYFSDIHLEIRESETRLPWIDIYPLDLGPYLKPYRGEADLLVLAGDIGPAYLRRGLSVLLYAQQAGEYLGCQVVLVPGNHEYYHTVFEDARETLLAASRPDVRVLERSSICLDCGGENLRILGTTLWTDFELTGDFRAGLSAARSMDYEAITRMNGQAWVPQDAMAEHMKCREWLESELDKPHDGPTLIVTHHAPHTAIWNPNYSFKDDSSSFYSNLDGLISKAKSAGAVGWIFGHHHYNGVADVSGLPIMSAQWGYPHEAPSVTAWRGPGLFEFGKREAAEAA